MRSAGAVEVSGLYACRSKLLPLTIDHSAGDWYDKKIMETKTIKTEVTCPGTLFTVLARGHVFFMFLSTTET